MFLAVLVLSSYGTFVESLHEGDSCDLTSGNPGVCTELNNCRSVLEELKFGNSTDLVCGYSGFEPIVCCPKSTLYENTATPPSVESEAETGAIARRKCAEFSQYVYSLTNSPVLTSEQNLLNVSQCGISTHTFFGDNRYANPKEFPYMAAIGYDLDDGDIGWYCGGTLISEIFVLTAAHCTYSLEWGNATWVRVGDLILNRSSEAGSTVDRRVTERIRHPDSKPPSQYHDIAILRLESYVPLNGWIRPACLHTAPSTGTQLALATGWGRVNDDGSRNLRVYRLRLVDPRTCNANWTSGTVNILPNGVVGNWSICAEAEDKDTCQGDAGGSLIIYNNEEYCMYNVVGVMGFGKLCNGRNPGIYTRVYYYIRWIESTVWERG